MTDREKAVIDACNSLGKVKEQVLDNLLCLGVKGGRTRGDNVCKNYLELMLHARGRVIGTDVRLVELETGFPVFVEKTCPAWVDAYDLRLYTRMYEECDRYRELYNK